MRVTARAASIALLALGLAAWAPHGAEAGIVVLKRGDVVVGNVELEGDKVVVSWPYGSRKSSGSLKIGSDEVRWLDAKHDVLTSEYFAEHLRDHLRGAVWLRQREVYLADQKTTVYHGLDMPEFKLSLDPLKRPGESWDGYTICRPRGWSAGTDNAGILIMRAPAEQGQGFRPRIHVFRVNETSTNHREQITWIERELESIQRSSKAIKSLRLRTGVTLKTDAKGQTQGRFETETHLAKRRVVALRRLIFRDGFTLVATAYADAEDMSAVRSLLESSLDSLKVGG